MTSEQNSTRLRAEPMLSGGNSLRQSEEALRDLFENATDLIQTVSPDGRLLYVNRAWRETLGYSHEEVATLSVLDIIHPDYRDHCMKVFQRLMAGETVRNVEAVFVTKEGKAITVVGSINCRFENGKPVATRGIFHDITERMRMQEALRIRTTALEAAGDAIVVTDCNGIIEYVNPAFTAITGYSPDEAVGQKPSIFKSGKQDMSFYKALWETILAGKVWHGELVNRRKDGSLYTEEMTIAPVKDVQGQIARFIAIKRDVTERKRAEGEIVRQNRFLNTVLESLPHPFMVIDTEDYSVAMANTAARRDAPPGAETCFAMTHHRDSACDGVEGPCPLVEVKQTGTPAMVEHIHCQADGSPRTVEVHAYPVFDENKRVVQVIEYSLDITERKRGEEALRESEERLKFALEGANDGVWDWDVPTGVVVFSERWAAMLGYDLSEIEPHVRAWEKLVHPDDMPSATEALSAHLDGRTPFYESEHRLRTKSGEWKWVLDRGKVVARDKDGRPLRATGTHKDITQRKQAEEEVEALHEQLLAASRQAGMAEVATGVLHNVGNVLNSVNVSSTIVTDRVRRSKVSGLVKATELMREHSEDLATFITADEKGKNLPGYLAKLAQHLVQEQASILDELVSLTENIEHIKRIVAMQQTYAGVSGVVESVSIADVLEDAMKINAAGLGRHGVHVVRDYAKIRPVVLEKHKLLQILVNLLSNAKYAMDETEKKDRELVLRIGTVGDDRVRIDVVDNGVGIAEENLSRVFSHGFTTKKDGHGFGLHHSGLAAQEMGGTLTAHSDGPCKGATFTLELPVQREEAAL